MSSVVAVLDDEVQSTMDPLQILGADVFGTVTSSLDASMLARCSTVSGSWLVACSTATLWRGHCQELWQGKRYVPDDIRLSPDPRKAYALSLVDCRRTTITATELCTFAWTFKFKHQALDQAVHGTSGEMVRYFQHDGCYVTGDNDAAFQHPRYRWHFSTNNDGCPGLFIQVHRFPRLSITRTADWGWRLENPWVVFTSRTSPATASLALPCSHPLAPPATASLAPPCSQRASAACPAAAAAAGPQPHCPGSCRLCSAAGACSPAKRLAARHQGSQDGH